MPIATRADFKEYCLRALGKPVLTIDIHADQASDRIDDALSMFAKYHFDGTNHVYYKHQITSQDKTNKYITMPDNILGAVKVFPLHGNAYTGNDMFDIRYQLVMNDLYSFNSIQMAPYVMIMTRMNEIQELLVGQIPIRYNKLDQKLHLDMDWNNVTVGHWLIVEAYEVVDPEDFAGVWDDIWLKEYTTALFKRQWAQNLSKFANIQLPGGVQLNAAEMFQQAENDIRRLKQELEDDYMMMPLDRMA